MQPLLMCDCNSKIVRRIRHVVLLASENKDQPLYEFVFFMTSIVAWGVCPNFEVDHALVPKFSRAKVRGQVGSALLSMSDSGNEKM